MAQAYPKPQQGKAMSREVGGQVAPAGLWEHPESGQQAITLDDPLFGNAQSQAFLQAGFKFVRDVEPDEIVTLPQLALDQQANDRDALKGVMARVSQLEGVADENESLRKRVRELEAEKAARGESGGAAQSGEEAKKAAFDKVAKDQGQDPAPGEPKAPVDTDEVKPLSKQNATELKATAETEGVDVTGADTNKKLAAAIQAARDAKESEK